MCTSLPTLPPEDEQVALKKKLKETLEEEVGCFWAKSGNEKTHTEKMETANPDKVKLSVETLKNTVSTALFWNCSIFNSYKIFFFVRIQQ